MEEATMSQNAEMPATENIAVTNMSDTPQDTPKKPVRFSADAFRALSSRLNPSAPANDVAPEQIIPDTNIEMPVVLEPVVETVVATPPQVIPVELSVTEPAVVETAVAAVVEQDAISHVLPEVAPEIVPEVAPEIVPEVAPEIVPEVAPAIAETMVEETAATETTQVQMPPANGEVPDLEMLLANNQANVAPVAAPVIEPAAIEPVVIEPLVTEPVVIDAAQTQTPIVDVAQSGLPNLPDLNADIYGIQGHLHGESQAVEAPVELVADVAMPDMQVAILPIEEEPVAPIAEPVETVETVTDPSPVFANYAIPEFEIPHVEIPQVDMPNLHDTVHGTGPATVQIDQSVELPVEPALPLELALSLEPEIAPNIDLATPFDNVPVVDNTSVGIENPKVDEVTAVDTVPMPSSVPATSLKSTGLSLAEMLANEPQLPSVEQPVPVPVTEPLINEPVEIGHVAAPVTVAAPVINPTEQFDLQSAIDLQTGPEQLSQEQLSQEQPSQEQPSQEQVSISPVEPLIEMAPVPESIPAVEPEIPVETAPTTEAVVAKVEPVIADETPTPAPALDAIIDQEVAVNEAPSTSGDPLLEAMRLMQEVGISEPQAQSSPASSFVDATAPLSALKDDQTSDQADVEASPQIAKQADVLPEPKTVVSTQDVEPEYELELEPDEKSGETARALLDMMSASGGAAQPQERALAADTLLQLVPRMPERDLIMLSERVGMMDEPPSLLVDKLINNRSAKVAQPLLEGGQLISDQVLFKLIKKCDVDRLTMVSKRRTISLGVCDALIARGEASVYLTLVRNSGASLSHDAFITLCEIAQRQQTLQAPLATRGDTPPPIAFELFWSLPVELRRYVLSRFLTDSATLDKILKIAQSVNGDEGVEASGNQHFPPRRKVDELVEKIAEGRIDAAVETMAVLAEIQPENARRIVSDPDGEPLIVALKMLGISRAKFSKAIKLFSTTPAAPLSSERDLPELQAMFDGLSFNKARTLMKYWDWAIEKTGPYARRSM